MTKRIVVLIAALSISSGVSAQEPTSQPPQEPVVEPAPTPARVVGQAQTQEELDAYSQTQQATNLEELQRLSQEFLESYPESGLTPFVHYNLSTAYRRNNDPPNFILHGEKALTELPDLADVAAYLAFFYSEQGEGTRARQCAQQAMDILAKMPKPEQLSARVWTSQKFALNAEAHYAMGRVALAEAMESSPPAGDLLETAVSHLEQSLEQAPDHSYAAFRLAEAYTRKQAYEEAISAYARSVAMGGVIADYARSSLERVYEHVHGGQDGMEKEIAEQKEMLAQKMAEREQLLEQIEEKEKKEQESLEAPVVRPPA